MNLLSLLINGLLNACVYEKKLKITIKRKFKKRKIQFDIPDFSSCKNIFEKGKIFILFYTIKENNKNTIKGENEIIINQNNESLIKQQNTIFNILNPKITKN